MSEKVESTILYDSISLVSGLFFMAVTWSGMHIKIVEEGVAVLMSGQNFLCMIIFFIGFTAPGQYTKIMSNR